MKAILLRTLRVLVLVAVVLHPSGLNAQPPTQPPALKAETSQKQGGVPAKRRLTENEIHWPDVDHESRLRDADHIVRPAVKRHATDEEKKELTDLKAHAEHLWKQHEYADAEADFRTIVSRLQTILGEEFWETLHVRNELAGLMDTEGKYAESEQEYRTVLAIQERLYGAGYPNTCDTRRGLASMLNGQGKFAEAEKEYRKMVAALELMPGEEAPKIARLYRFYVDLSWCLEKQGKLKEALEFIHRAETGQALYFGPDHIETLGTRKIRERLEKKPTEREEEKKLLELIKSGYKK